MSAKPIRMLALAGLGTTLFAQACLAQDPIVQPAPETGWAPASVAPAYPVEGQPIYGDPGLPVSSGLMMAAPIQQSCISSDGSADWMNGTIMEPNTAYVTVTLPEKAKLFVNGDPTASTGPVRYFVVRRMDDGETFKFDFRAEMENAAGVKLEEKKQVLLKAGSSESFNLTPWKKVPEEKKEEGGAAEPAAPAK